MRANLRICVLVVCILALPGTVNCANSGPSIPRPASGITVIAPAAAVHPNDTSNITVIAADNLSISRLIVAKTSDYEYAIKGSRDYDVSGNGPWFLPLPVPDIAIGELKVFVIAFRAGEKVSDLTSNTITIPVDLGTAKLTNLSIEGPFGCEVDPHRTYRISVNGSFSDGVDRDCSNMKLGTTYTSSSPEILAIDANGAYTCLKQGTAVITARYGGHVAHAEVNLYLHPH